MGLPRQLGEHGLVIPEPPESHCDGCPGGWYRCTFVESALRYERLMFESGFSDNVLLSRTDDPLVIEATQYLEIERLRHRNYWKQKIGS